MPNSIIGLCKGGGTGLGEVDRTRRGGERLRGGGGASSLV